MQIGVATRLDDLKTVLNQTEDHRCRVLANSEKEIRVWVIKVKKIKAIYHTLNMCNFDVSHNSLIAECWCPVSALEDVQRSLRHGTVSHTEVTQRSLRHVTVSHTEVIQRSHRHGTLSYTEVTGT